MVQGDEEDEVERLPAARPVVVDKGRHRARPHLRIELCDRELGVVAHVDPRHGRKLQIHGLSGHAHHTARLQQRLGQRDRHIERWSAVLRHDQGDLAAKTATGGHHGPG